MARELDHGENGEYNLAEDGEDNHNEDDVEARELTKSTCQKCIARNDTH